MNRPAPMDVLRTSHVDLALGGSAAEISILLPARGAFGAGPLGPRLRLSARPLMPGQILPVVPERS